MGVRGQTVLEWFKSYLSSRSQAVFINGVLSEHEQIKCGVSQGSILAGPLLFLIYINDLSSIIDFATTRMYADDTNLIPPSKVLKLLNKVKTANAAGLNNS